MENTTVVQNWKALIKPNKLNLKSKKFEIREGYDHVLSLTILSLLLIGFVMVYSSSAVYAMEEYGDPYFFIKRQAMWLALGCTILFYFSSFNYKNLEGLAYPTMAITFILLILVSSNFIFCASNSDSILPK